MLTKAVTKFSCIQFGFSQSSESLIVWVYPFACLFSCDFILLLVKLFPGRFLTFLNSITFGWYFQGINKSVFNSSNLFSNIFSLAIGREKHCLLIGLYFALACWFWRENLSTLELLYVHRGGRVLIFILSGCFMFYHSVLFICHTKMRIPKKIYGTQPNSRILRFSRQNQHASENF